MRTRIRHRPVTPGLRSSQLSRRRGRKPLPSPRRSMRRPLRMSDGKALMVAHAPGRGAPKARRGHGRTNRRGLGSSTDGLPRASARSRLPRRIASARRGLRPRSPPNCAAGRKIIVADWPEVQRRLSPHSSRLVSIVKISAPKSTAAAIHQTRISTVRTGSTSVRLLGLKKHGPSQ